MAKWHEETHTFLELLMLLQEVSRRVYVVCQANLTEAVLG